MLRMLYSVTLKYQRPGALCIREIFQKMGCWFLFFANLHSVSAYQGNQFEFWHPAAGAGLRIEFHKISRTNVSIDVGISKDYTGIYLSLVEAF